MDDFNNINANILLGAAISAGATERQTREMSKKLQEASEASSVAYMELAAAIREQNYLLSLNEEERKEYFRIKQELEEKRRREAKREEEIRRQKEIEIRNAQIIEKEETKKALKQVAISAFILIFIVAVIVGLSCLVNSNNDTEKPQEVVNIVNATPDHIQCKHCKSTNTKCSEQYFTASGQKMDVTPETNCTETVYTYFSCEDCNCKTMYYVYRKGE